MVSSPTTESTPLIWPTPPISPTSAAQPRGRLRWLPLELDETWSRRVLMGGLFTFAFLAALDGTIVAALVGTIGSSFDDLQSASWLGTAFYVTSSCFTPLYGRVVDLFGRRNTMLVATTVLGFSTVLCGLATSMRQLIACRALAGSSAGGMGVVAMSVIADETTLQERGVYAGIANMLYGLGASVGGVFGGWIADTWGWRWAFFIQAPIFVAGCTVLFSRMADPPALDELRKTYSMRDVLKRVDVLGAMLVAGSTALIIIGLDLKAKGGRGWTDGSVFGLIVAGLFLLVVLCVVEVWCTAHPIIPLHLFKQRNPAFVFLVQTLVVASWMSLVYNVPLFLVTVKQSTASQAGSHLIPHSIGLALGSSLAGQWIKRSGKVWSYQVVTCIAFALCSLPMLLWNVRSPKWLLVLPVLAKSFFASSLSTSTMISLQSSIPHSQIPIATGTSFLFRSLGSSVSISLTAMVGQATLANELARRITGEGSEKVISQILHSTDYSSLSQRVRNIAVQSWTIAFQHVFILQTVFGLLSIVGVLFIRECSLTERAAQHPADEDAEAA